MLLFLMVSTTENNKITHEKKFGTHEIFTGNIWDPRNTHEKKFGAHEIPTKARWHDATKPTRPTIARDPPNLAHSS